MHRISLVLAPHPTTIAGAVRSIEVSVARLHKSKIALAYRLTGDIARLRIQNARPPQPADELWRHTCFEAFVAAAGEAQYTEFNLAPSSEWATYRFTAYRAGLRRVEEPPEIAVRRAGDFLELDAILCTPAHEKLAVGLSAVVEDEKGELSYWALKHPGAEPDFHHRDSFALAL